MQVLAWSLQCRPFNACEGVQVGNMFSISLQMSHFQIFPEKLPSAFVTYVVLFLVLKKTLLIVALGLLPRSLTCGAVVGVVVGAQVL